MVKIYLLRISTERCVKIFLNDLPEQYYFLALLEFIPGAENSIWTAVFRLFGTARIPKGIEKYQYDYTLTIAYSASPHFVFAHGTGAEKTELE